ncbi:hypothetical protein ACTXLJ_11090 [Psychrobacter celer]|uniref:hypothetical protein n=1 Tax=Psychrobacter celer TaxID=306572 RepID=UPI003FD386FD
MTVTIVCFHTCNNCGSKVHILNKAPFLSNSSKAEWLGTGYYFWTDSDYYAHEWGKIPPRNGEYVIISANVNVNYEDFLDLVGNVEHQLHFNELVTNYKNHLRYLISTARGSSEKTNLETALKNLSVSSVIQHYRKQRVFDYKVVKAQDMPKRTTKDLVYVQTGRGESLFYPTRQQLVVYQEAKSCISNKKLYCSKP